MALLAVGISLCLIDGTHGAISCTTNKECEDTLRRGSICLEETKTCSNPYQRGCLTTLLPKDHELSKTIRVCNSDDVLPDATQSGLCYRPDFEYEELRIHNVSVCWWGSVCVFVLVWVGGSASRFGQSLLRWRPRFEFI